METKGLSIALVICLIALNVETRPRIKDKEGDQEILDICPGASYKGPFKIKSTPYRPQIINIEKTTVKLKAHKRWMRVYSFKRIVYKKYCYNGGGLDPNTGCYTTYKNVTTSIESLVEMTRSNKCPIGQECAPNGRCYGSDASICQDDSIIEGTVGDKTLKWIAEEYMLFAKHTCIKSWMCEAHNSLVRLSIVENPHSTIGFTLPDGHFIEIVEDGTWQSYKDSSGYTHHFKTPEPQPSTLREMQCIGHSKVGIMCQEMENKGEDSDLVYMFNTRTLKSRFRNKELEIVGDYHLIDEKGDIFKVEKKNEEEQGNMQPLAMSKSATIDDVITTINSLHRVQLQEIFNSLSLSKQVKRIENTINTIVKEMMKRDDDILGRIIGRRLKTRMINEEYFDLAECGMSMDPSTNCAYGFVYKDGTWIRNKKQETACMTINDNEAKNVSVFEDLELDVRFVKEATLVTTTRDSSTWEWLANTRQIIGSNMGYSKETYNLVESLGKAVDEITSPFSQIVKWFSALTSVVCWVALAMHFLRRS